MRKYLVISAFIASVLAGKDLGFVNQWEHNGQSFEGGLRMPETKPELCSNLTEQWSGYYEVETRGHKKNYFYWAFQNQKRSDTAPTVLWMTGGPGCSSLLALFTENGPCQMKTDGTVVPNPYSWNQDANLIFVDQPAGTGYSYSSILGYDHNEKEVAADMGQFIQSLFKAHPEWQKNDFFIFGESYGGHYVPAVSNKVFMMNKDPNNLHIPLAGVGIGNGLVDPLVQFPFYPELAYNYSIKKQGKPVVTLKTYEKMKKAVPECEKLLKECNSPSHKDCALANSICSETLIGPYAETGQSVYNIEKPCTPPPLCIDLSALKAYLNSARVKNALGVPAHVKWEACNNIVNAGFRKDIARDFQQDLLPLLESGTIRVLIYAGDLDFICNWLGNQAWTLGLPWSGKDGFNSANFYQWYAGAKSAGEVRTYKNFNFMRVYNAGHMAPHNQPMVAQTMLNLFIKNQTFPSHPL